MDTGNNFTPSPLRILLVEDSEHDTAAFNRALDKGGLKAEVTHFVKAEEALKSLQISPLSYDLVVADYKLPGMTGLELCKQIINQQIPLPCIIVTSAGTEHIAVEALKAGVFDYLVKDFQQNYLQLLPLLLPEVVRKYQDRLSSRIFRREREVIAGISEMFLAPEDLETLCRKLPDAIVAGFAFPVSAILLLDENRKEMVVKGVSGIADTTLLNKRVPLEKTTCCQTIEQGQPVLKLDIAANPDLHCFLKDSGINTCLSVPIKGKRSGVMGALVLADFSTRSDADIHISALQVISHHLGQEIERKQVEDELCLRNEIMGNMAEGVYLVQASTLQIIYANPVFEKMFGYDPGEMLGKHVSIVNAPTVKSPQETATMILEVLSDKGFWQGEVKNIKKDGTPFWCSASVSGFEHHEYGKVWISIHTDIADRKQAVETLRASEARMYTLIEALPDLVWLKDKDGIFLVCNRKFERLFGTPATEIVGKTDYDFVDTKLADFFREKDKVAMAAGKSTVNEEEVVYADNGHREILETIKTPMFDPAGKLIGILGIARDITDRKKTEIALRNSEKQWNQTFNSIPDIVTFLDTDLRILKVNQQACSILDLSSDEIIGKHCYELFHDSKEPCQDCPLTQTKESLKAFSGEIYHEKLGKTFLVSETPVFGELGELEYIAHVAKDITAQKRLEKELFQAQKMEAIGTLAGGIAHDFNNILSAIIGFSEVAKLEMPADSRAGKDIDKVIKAGRRAAELVKQILTFSRMTDHQLQPMIPNLIIKEALKMLRSSLPTTISIKEAIDTACGLILADPTNVHQIVMNLCTNAFHAMENEKGILTVNLYRKEIRAEDICESDVSAGPFVVLSVSDTGHGMDKITMERIFEPYFTTKEVGKGTGLGLAVIHGIIKDYKGFIRVESEPEKGTTFHVHFPALVKIASTQEKTEEDVPTGTERILIVDDESSIVNLHKTVLQRLGYRVTATTNSEEALEKIRLHPEQFDLLITDQTMPGLSGFELAKKVLQIKPNIGIILSTGYSSAITEKEALAIGIKKYAEKPVDRTTLAKIVREVLGNN